MINPDHYLETGHGRVFTPERNRQAWQLAYARLTEELTKRRKGAHVYLVIEVVGACSSGAPDL